jgi:hypothetical protein
MSHVYIYHHIAYDSTYMHLALIDINTLNIDKHKQLQFHHIHKHCQQDFATGAGSYQASAGTSLEALCLSSDSTSHTSDSPTTKHYNYYTLEPRHDSVQVVMSNSPTHRDIITKTKHISTLNINSYSSTIGILNMSEAGSRL